MLSLTNGLGAVASFAYDSLNRRTTELDAFGTPLQRTLTTVYDADDNGDGAIDDIDRYAFLARYGTTFSPP